MSRRGCQLVECGSRLCILSSLYLWRGWNCGGHRLPSLGYSLRAAVSLLPCVPISMLVTHVAILNRSSDRDQTVYDQSVYGHPTQ